MPDSLDEIVGHGASSSPSASPAPQPPDSHDGIVGRVKEWYAKRSSRFKYNAELAVGTLAEYPGGLVGSIVGKEIVCAGEAAHVSLCGESLGGHRSTIVTLVTVVGSGIAYWTSWYALRYADQKKVYQRYPEIQRQDTVRFIGAAVLSGIVATVIRSYATYRFNEMGLGQSASAVLGMLPAQAFSFLALNAIAKYAKLVRGPNELLHMIQEVREKRGHDHPTDGTAGPTGASSV